MFEEGKVGSRSVQNAVPANLIFAWRQINLVANSLQRSCFLSNKPHLDQRLGSAVLVVPPLRPPRFCGLSGVNLKGCPFTPQEPDLRPHQLGICIWAL